MDPRSYDLPLRRMFPGQGLLWLLFGVAFLSGCAISPRANEGKVVVIAGASSGFA
jgi:hypothetical protein